MLNNLLTSVFGSRNERLLKQLNGQVKKINALEPEMQALSDEALKAKTEEFKARIAKGESLDKILPEAFAVCREASVRVFGMRHFDVQLIGGMVLHLGKIAEMRTGEGKTLMATLRGVPQRAGRQGRPRHHRQRLPGPSRRRLDGQALHLAGTERGRGLSGHAAFATSTAPTPPTSPTRPTTRSASTTCATTWRWPRKTVSSAA